MSDTADTRRADADYELRRNNDTSRAWILTDKRTGHRWMFTHVQPNGYKNTVFLRHLSPFEHQNGHTVSTGNRVAILDKEELPDWLVEEFEHIYETGNCTPATDPRN